MNGDLTVTRRVIIQPGMPTPDQKSGDSGSISRILKNPLVSAVFKKNKFRGFSGGTPETGLEGAVAPLGVAGAKPPNRLIKT
jgi:hypothetical protein